MLGVRLCGFSVDVDVDIAELADLFSAKPKMEKAARAKELKPDPTVRLLQDLNRVRNCEVRRRGPASPRICTSLLTVTGSQVCEPTVMVTAWVDSRCFGFLRLLV